MNYEGVEQPLALPGSAKNTNHSSDYLYKLLYQKSLFLAAIAALYVTMSVGRSVGLMVCNEFQSSTEHNAQNKSIEYNG